LRAAYGESKRRTTNPADIDCSAETAGIYRMLSRELTEAGARLASGLGILVELAKIDSSVGWNAVTSSTALFAHSAAADLRSTSIKTSRRDFLLAPLNPSERGDAGAGWAAGERTLHSPVVARTPTG